MTTISAQIVALHNGSDVVPAYTPLQPDQFQPPAITIWMNWLWFMSLIFSLTTALLGALLHQSARSYKRSISRFRSPHSRRQLRAYLFAGLVEWRISSIANVIPGLIEVTLIFFLGGLILFVWCLYQPLAKHILAMVVIGTLLYFIASFTPFFVYNFPYRTPFSQWLIYFFSLFTLLLKHLGYSNARPYSRLRLSVAEEKFQNSDSLLQAFRFVADAVDEDGEVEKIAESFPGLLDGSVLDDATLLTLSSEFMELYAPSIGNILDELLDDVGEDIDRRVVVLLRAIETALSHMNPVDIPKSKCWDELWFNRCTTLFLHQTSKVAQKAMAIYAYLASAESDGVPLNPNKLPSAEDLAVFRAYSPPTLPPGFALDNPQITRKLIVKCFDRADESEAVLMRKAWPNVYQALAGLSTSDMEGDTTNAPPENDNIPIAFANIAAIILERIGSEYISLGHPKLIEDVHTLVYACFTLMNVPQVKDTLETALSTYRKRRWQGEVLYDKFCEIRGIFSDGTDTSEDLEGPIVNIGPC
ncbi:hypothetical protein AX16_008573 [Volvariella volvacea WC 439]|nr:hypothetical protein AX16_008573 [Volvariella volvacea WC 439]